MAFEKFHGSKINLTWPALPDKAGIGEAVRLGLGNITVELTILSNTIIEINSTEILIS